MKTRDAGRGGRHSHPLRVVQEAVTLARRARELTPRLPCPSDERLRAQLRGACDSVYANIVEGHARPTARDTLRFLGTAWASLREFEVHLDVAEGASLVSTEGAAELRQRTRHVTRLLAGLRRYYQRR